MILLKKATIVNKKSALHLKQRDILINNGKIVKIAASITQENVRIIKHDDLHVSIGWMDSSVSLGEPGYEERQTLENGLKAAAAGGFTTIMLNPANKPNPQDRTGIDFIKNTTSKNAVTVHPVGNFTIDQAGEHLAQLFDMHQAGAVAFYDTKHAVSNANLVKIGLQYTKTFGGIIQSFPLDKTLAGSGQVNEDTATAHLGLRTQATLAEEININRDLALAAYTGGHLHIPTVTTAAGIRAIHAAKNDHVTCSVTVHHLACSTDDLSSFNCNYKVAPPLRSTADRDALVKAVKKGMVTMVTSDHTPLTVEDKELEFDQATPGTIGLESAFPILNNLVGKELAVEMLTAAYGVFTEKTPVIEENAIANLTLFTTSESGHFESRTIISTTKNSALLGKATLGKVLGIYNNNTFMYYGC